MGHEALQGLGKLSLPYVKKMISKSVEGSDGTVYSGASKLEILTLLYLSQIAEPSGLVREFKTKDIAETICCSERAVFVIFASLKKKGFITYKDYDNKRWTGLKDIRLLNNDFSSVNKYTKNTRYISTFYTFFDFTDESVVSFLNGLSLYALRTLLCILISYNYNTGLRMSCDRFCEELGIVDRSLIKYYLDELAAYFGDDFFTIRRGHNARITYGNVYIGAHKSSLQPEAAPHDEQMTYYKRRWLLNFKHYDMVCDYHFPLSRYLCELFNLVFRALEHGISLDVAEETLIDSLCTDDFIVDTRTLYNGRARLEALYT